MIEIGDAEKAKPKGWRQDLSSRDFNYKRRKTK